MPRFLRTFHCKQCKRQAKLDRISEEFAIIECPTCEVTEVWGHDGILKELEYFDCWDTPIGEA